jgi:restriction system protein
MMALWLVRAGRHGKHERRFLDDNGVYLTWGGALQEVDVTSVKDYEGLKRVASREETRKS